jgi:hypothetical protein
LSEFDAQQSQSELAGFVGWREANILAGTKPDSVSYVRRLLGDEAIARIGFTVGDRENNADLSRHFPEASIYEYRP